MAKGSIVCKVVGKRTFITVRDWPDRDAEWRVESEMPPKGRTLVCHGYSNFKRDVKVGHIVLHVEDDQPLRIISYEVSPNVLDRRRDDVLRQLFLCAKEVAEELQRKSVGNGSLEWQVPTGKRVPLLRAFHEFNATGKPGDRPATTLLRWG